MHVTGGIDRLSSNSLASSSSQSLSPSSAQGCSLRPNLRQTTCACPFTACACSAECRHGSFRQSRCIRLARPTLSHRLESNRSNLRHAHITQAAQASAVADSPCDRHRPVRYVVLAVCFPSPLTVVAYASLHVQEIEACQQTLFSA